MLRNIIEGLIKTRGKPIVFIFWSFIHGAGKSTLRKEFEKLLKFENFKVYSICSGEIFRKIAFEKNMSIEDLVNYLKNNFEESLKVDLEIDKRILKEVIELIEKKNYDVILVDSSLAPYYLFGKNIIKIYIFANLNIIAERVFKNRRFGDREFKDIKDVKKYLLKRSREDYLRYIEFAKRINDAFWRKVYSSYGKDVFDLKICNNSNIKETLNKLIEKLNEIMKKSPSAENDEGLEL